MDTERFDEELDEPGEEGWELVSYHSPGKKSLSQ